MSDRISVQELQAAVDKAVARIGGTSRPIVIGFVAPANFPEAEAHDIAQEVAKLSGLVGTPAVSVLGDTAAGEHFAASAKLLPPGHIIIGLVANTD